MRGKSPEVKSQVYNQLTHGQRALFMFRVLFDHASHSLDEFYSWISYLLAEPSTWGEVKTGLEVFQADAMLQILEEMEKFLQTRNRQGDFQSSEVTPQELADDSELFEYVNRLYINFLDISPATLKLISEFIQINPDEFVEFED
ncbi:hypothetical protein EFBL_1271 [Effusibacillus lacus]|uniref:Uncharacterized protein n=2 Tax=Effusibacillus lacus TaxID=1348429 RepID=A0A292YGH8_9BACL|nr:hypothetical protein EDD64_1431 [Effusibacillus lacus]GAX89647.1 hypothetical protein EFBL_1271 [Effusibacillus lacus]